MIGAATVCSKSSKSDAHICVTHQVIHRCDTKSLICATPVIHSYNACVLLCNIHSYHVCVLLCGIHKCRAFSHFARRGCDTKSLICATPVIHSHNTCVLLRDIHKCRVFSTTRRKYVCLIYRSLLQNIVFFIGLFCKRDL